MMIDKVIGVVTIEGILYAIGFIFLWFLGGWIITTFFDLDIYKN